MRIETDSAAYLNARKYWFEHHGHQHDDQVYRAGTNTYYRARYDYYQTVVKPFREWLSSQGCQIETNRIYGHEYGVDSYEVAVGTDYLKFESEQEYTMFLLKWS